MRRTQSGEKLILAIESSCDETAAAILRGNPNSTTPDYKILSSVVKSQVAIHRKTGGVVPEVAARAHIKNILPVTQLALQQAKTNLSDVDFLAVTAGPGLIVSLLVGVEFIKGLSLAIGKSVVPVNHMAGHLYSAFGAEKSKIKNQKSKLEFPVIALIVSGGHTMLIVMKDYLSYKVIGQAVDDAAGEAFDKVARLLGLPYPGGPGLSALAKRGKSIIDFPRPMMNSKDYNFSFSGLKTAVRYYLESLSPAPLPKGEGTRRAGEGVKANIACSFEEAVVDVLVQKTMRAAEQYQAKTVTLGGGVAANARLRKTLAKSCGLKAIKFVVPAMELCTDNAAMIAIAAYFRLRAKPSRVAPTKIKADPGWELTTAYSKISRS